MTPQERADAVDAAVRRSWDEVDPDFRDRALAEARILNAQLRDDCRVVRSLLNSSNGWANSHRSSSERVAPRGQGVAVPLPGRGVTYG